MVRAVVPGTFDPIHKGHIDIILRATNLFDEVIVSVYDRPLKSLLFSPEQRIDLVQQFVARFHPDAARTHHRVLFSPVPEVEQQFALAHVALTQAA